MRVARPNRYGAVMAITKRTQKQPLLRPVFKCHGGKNYLKQHIIDNFPPDYQRLVYIEPYSGAGSVILNKRPGAAETLNDIHPGIVAIFSVVKDGPVDFMRRLEALTYSSETFTAALQRAASSTLSGIDLAVNEYTLRRMSRGGLKRDFAWSDRLRGGQPGDVNAWQTAIAQIPALSDRLRGVRITSRDGLELLKESDDENVLAYLDPPYLHSTRAAEKAYDFEMGEADHVRLCEALIIFKGKAIISGYDSPLYNKLLAGWNRVGQEIANHSSQSSAKSRKIEWLWRNY